MDYRGFYLYLSTAWAKPIDFFADLMELSPKQPIEEMGEYFEGDMKLTEDQEKSLFDSMMDKRTGLIHKRFRWPGNTVRYQFAHDVNYTQRKYIKLALGYISYFTCIKFAEARFIHKNYVYVTTNADGCFSNVGRKGGKQILNLQSDEPGAGCFQLGTIVHEFIHTLGFHHAQSAYNRDDYVKIIRENINPDFYYNFQKLNSSYTTMFGLGYDYESLMHYGQYAFSINGQPTIVPLKLKVQIGQRTGMSELDIKRINKMYKCPHGDLKKKPYIFPKIK